MQCVLKIDFQPSDITRLIRKIETISWQFITNNMHGKIVI